MKSRFFVSVCLLAFLLSACGSAPKTSYYTLSAPPALFTPATGTGTSVIVGPVSVPELNDQALLVVQNSNNQVSMSEFHRWAGSLKSDIARVIAANLTHDLGTPRVWSYAQSTQTKADYQVLIDIQSFDAKTGEAVVLDVLWTIRPLVSNAANVIPANTGGRVSDMSRSGRSLVREPVSGAGFEALVAAQSRALKQVSADIAKGIR